MSRRDFKIDWLRCIVPRYVIPFGERNSFQTLKGDLVRNAEMPPLTSEKKCSSYRKDIVSLCHSTLSVVFVHTLTEEMFLIKVLVWNWEKLAWHERGSKTTLESKVI